MQWINYTNPDVITAVIMAGGKGQRLTPLTLDTPKPMLRIAEKPLLEIIILQLKKFGIKNILISVNYKKHIIENYFKNGDALGVKINYLYEDSLRGTAGCLSALKKSKNPLLIFNGDILASIQFDQMLLFHQKEKSQLTIGVVSKKYTIPYGVVEMSGFSVSAIIEKPIQYYAVNAGVYVIEPELLTFIPDVGSFHMTELINRALENSKKIVAYHIQKYWQDIGTPEDYQKASSDYYRMEIV